MRAIQLLGKDLSTLLVAGNSIPHGRPPATLINALNHALTPPPVPEDVDPQLYGVIDGTFYRVVLG